MADLLTNRTYSASPSQPMGVKENPSDTSTHVTPSDWLPRHPMMSHGSAPWKAVGVGCMCSAIKVNLLPRTGLGVEVSHCMPPTSDRPGSPSAPYYLIRGALRRFDLPFGHQHGVNLGSHGGGCVQSPRGSADPLPRAGHWFLLGGGCEHVGADRACGGKDVGAHGRDDGHDSGEEEGRCARARLIPLASSSGERKELEVVRIHIEESLQSAALETRDPGGYKSEMGSPMRGNNKQRKPTQGNHTTSCTSGYGGACDTSTAQ